ncbi:MAG: prepilin-type N-terminal cleavage/methylation domain-containing protein, partial [bacterium]|nr:prepilin-type N-terminal cleavage/methylation domain-containing protein [bacterium]
MKGKKGFTLVEMLITLFIVGVMAVLAVNMGRSSLQRARFTNIINQFMADYSYARMLASRQNRYVAIEFDTEGTLYTIRVQRSLSDTVGFDDVKTERLQEGDPFVNFLGEYSSFAVNSMGLVREYEASSGVGSDPITLELQFFTKDVSSGSNDYEKKVTLYATGGI